MILQHTDRISSTLLQSELSSVEGHEISMLTVQTLQGMSTERDFDLFWAKIETTRKQFEVEEPILPRRRKFPQRLGDCMARSEFPDSVIDWSDCSTIWCLIQLCPPSNQDLIMKDIKHFPTLNSFSLRKRLAYLLKGSRFCL